MSFIWGSRVGLQATHFHWGTLPFRRITRELQTQFSYTQFHTCNAIHWSRVTDLTWQCTSCSEKRTSVFVLMNFAFQNLFKGHI